MIEPSTGRGNPRARETGGQSHRFNFPGLKEMSGRQLRIQA